MPVDDYWGSESTELNVDEAVEVDLDGNPVTPGAQRDIPKSVIEAVGDLIVGTDVAEVGRVPIGTPGQALVVSPGGTTLEYATPASQVHTHDEYSTDADLADHLATAHAGLATDAELAAHEGAANPHPGYLTPAEGDAAYAPVHAHPYAPTSHAHVDADIPAGIARDSEVTAAVSAHESASDPHPTYETSAEAAMKITAHEAAGNPHPTYHTSAEVAADIATHEGAADPHTGYLKESVVSGPGSPGLTYSNVNVPGTATTVLRTDDTIAIFDGTVPTPEAFGDSGSVGSAGKAARRDHRHAMPANPVTGHEAAADPHTGYQKESEKGTASGYAGLDAGTKVPTAQLGTGTADATKFLRGDQSWQVVAGGTSIPQQASEPAGSVANDLWIDTDEGAGVGLSSIVAYAEKTSNQGSITAEVDVVGLSVNVTVPAGRRLKLTASAFMKGTTVNTTSIMRIKEGSTILNMAQIPNVPANIGNRITAIAIISPSAGAHTYKVTAEDFGGGTGQLDADVLYPAFLLVEDITGTLWPAGQSIGAGAIASEAWTTFTATPVPTGGTFTTASGVGAYIKMGRTVTLRYAATITTVGSATGDIRFVPPIPFSTTDLFYFGGGRESGLTGDDLRAFWPGGVDPTKIQIAGSTLASGKIYAVAFSYEAAS